ncbi:uncharacterized protein TRIVIDRAFT_211891 [Trichoderma virens Gv29-8]|uniref:Uncharacterized protein n=1 Tax=Hypocrea virens (strain Gv29-8 / FGSC 10586) TaxID=413071 RepID=G9MIF5_HYPVG|nr:uncharacterized protein TRIVIDRAFT_211891 [Trichoderma virens Gv29-8]EHK25272.1 hypothetical protein TRIVIDRAFT_211891 [Trichoderma virens Gv29-8]
MQVLFETCIWRGALLKNVSSGGRRISLGHFFLAPSFLPLCRLYEMIDDYVHLCRSLRCYKVNDGGGTKEDLKSHDKRGTARSHLSTRTKLHLYF